MMIKQRLSLALSLLWRTYLAFLIYSALLSLVLGFTIGGALLISRAFFLLAPPVTLGVFALLLVVLEAGCGVNLVRAVFGARLKRSAAQWRRYAFQLALLLGAMAILNALLAFLVPFEIWVYLKVYGSPLLFTVGIFALGWSQTPSSAVETSSEQAVTDCAPKWP